MLLAYLRKLNSALLLCTAATKNPTLPNRGRHDNSPRS